MHSINSSELECLNETVLSFLASFDAEYSSYQYAYVSVLLALGGSGIALNAGLLFGLLFRRSQPHSPLFSLVLVIELLVANLLVSVFCLLADGIWNVTVEWRGGNCLCRLIKYLQMFSLYATTLLLTGMSVEACITVVYPLSKTHRSITLPRIRLISIFAWIFAAVCSIPQAVIFHTEKAPTTCVDFYQCVTHGSYSDPSQELAYTLATLFIMLIVPVVINILCFVTILVKISNEAEALLAGSMTLSPHPFRKVSLTETGKQTQGERLFRQARRISLWMTCFTSFTFVVCWVPYSVIMIAHLLHWKISHETRSGIFCLGMSYSVLNPLLIGIFVVKRNEKNHHATKRASLASQITYDHTRFS